MEIKSFKRILCVLYYRQSQSKGFVCKQYYSLNIKIDIQYISIYFLNSFQLLLHYSKRFISYLLLKKKWFLCLSIL